MGCPTSFYFEMYPTFQQIFVLVTWITGIHCQISTTWAASRFIGYYVAPDSIEPLLAGTSWVTSASYAGDCSGNGRCVMATNCQNGTVYYDNESSTKCPGAFTCVEMTIFATSPNVLPSAYNYGCRMGWKANTVYRELAATITSSSSVPSNTITPAPTTPSSTPTTSVSSAPSSTTPPASGLQSTAWIAAAVIGPLIGIALITAAVFWWRKRRAGVKNSGDQAYEQGHKYALEYTSNQQYHEKDHVVRPVELPSSQQPSELSTDYR